MMQIRTAFALALAIAATVATAADVLVESRPGGLNYTGYKEMSGTWIDSNTPETTAKSAAKGLSPQSLGSRKFAIVSDGNKNSTLAAARFAPPIEAPGDYHVYITFSRAGNATPVRYVVHHAKGESIKETLQNGWGTVGTKNSDIWIDLGVYPFTPGTEQYVELQIPGNAGPVDPANPIQAFADAARFTTDALPAATEAQPASEPQKPGPRSVATPRPTPAPVADSGPLTWESNLASGRSAAASRNKKMLVFFYSPQSSRSTEYEEKVINSPKVKAAISQSFVPVKINMDIQRDLAAQLQVFRAGTINVYDAQTGGAIETISDTPAADELAKRLNAVK